MKYLLIPLLFFASCSKPQTAPSVAPSTPDPVPVAISLAQVIKAFENAKLPIKKRAIYDESTDPNNLLGRPGQYVEKMNFTDARGHKTPLDCSIEVFPDNATAATRKNYIDSIGKAASIYAAYSYLHHNVLVRISFAVLPKDADAYRQALESISLNFPFPAQAAL